MKESLRNPRREAEGWSFAERTLTLLDGIAARIEPQDGDLAAWFPRYFQQHRQRFAADLEIIEAHVEAGARILEVGAIPLVMTAALAVRHYQVRAVDLAPERFAQALTGLGLEVSKCDVETQVLPFADESFDAVVFNELFEHLRINPIFTLREVHRVLEPGGLLLLSTPNLRSLRGLRNLLLRNQGHAASGGIYAQYEKLETLGHMGHVREYTTREVGDFLTRLGFQVDKVLFRGGHGKGVVGVVERLAPSLRPFFTLFARKHATPAVTSAQGDDAS